MGTCFVRLQSVRVNFACKNDISISRQKQSSMSAMGVCVPGAQYSFWRAKQFLFLSFGQAVYIFEESSKSIQDVIEDVYCPGDIVSTEKNGSLLEVM